MPNKYVIYFLLAILLGNVVVWLQVNGQLAWQSWKNNPLILSALGMPISYLFIKATQWGVQGFDNQLWPLRLVGFAVGMVVFGVMTAVVLHQFPTPKTVVCILLCLAVILIQIYF